VVNTKFWKKDAVDERVPVTVFRTVHVGDVVKAWEADWPDPDDFIGSDRVGRGRGTLVFEGGDARQLALAAGDDHEALASHVRHQRLIVEDQRSGRHSPPWWA
jgi:hypothetical protein